jgi:hypothetical protein
MGMTSYSAELEHAINTYQMIPRDSRWEIEIRAPCIYATALLSEEINNLRPADQQISFRRSTPACGRTITPLRGRIT